jgi:hypothetical protein
MSRGVAPAGPSDRERLAAPDARAFCLEGTGEQGPAPGLFEIAGLVSADAVPCSGSVDFPAREGSLHLGVSQIETGRGGLTLRQGYPEGIDSLGEMPGEARWQRRGLWRKVRLSRVRTVIGEGL